MPFVLKAVFNLLKSTIYNNLIETSINEQMECLTDIFYKSFYEKNGCVFPSKFARA